MNSLLKNPLIHSLLASLAGLWIGLGVLEFCHPHYFLNDDNASSYIGGFLLSSRTLFETGRLAEINYYQYGGLPFISQAQAGVLYPPVYISYLLAKWVSGDLRWLIDWQIALHFSLGLAGFWLWQIDRRVPPVLAGVGSLLWVLSPFSILLTGSWAIVSNVVCYLPWLFVLIDRLIARPRLRTATSLGVVAGLFFLGGTVQWMSYAALLAGIYLYLRLRNHPWSHASRLLPFALWALAVFAVLTLPLIYPVSAAVAVSEQRSVPLIINAAIQRSVDLNDFILAQFTDFKQRELPTFVLRRIRTLPTVLFASPEVFCLPYIMIVACKSAAVRRKRILIPLSLALLAFIFSTKAHLFLSVLPLFDRYRWPFKVFVFFRFFFLTALMSAFAEGLGQAMRFRSRQMMLMLGVLVLVILDGVFISVAHFNDAMLSESRLPSLTDDLPPMDSTQGRAVAMGVFLGVSTNFDRYLAKNYGTIFQMPEIGGYEPLVARAQSNFGFRLNEENLFNRFITPEIRAALDSRAVRYFIIKKELYQGLGSEGFKNTRLLENDPDRIVVENLQAEPLAISVSGVGLPLRYHGNSLLIDLSGKTGKVGVSLSETDGWWYRVDGFDWMKPVYDGDRAWCMVPASGRTLEVRYFNRGFRQGLKASAVILTFLLLIAGTIQLRRRWRLR